MIQNIHIQRLLVIRCRMEDAVVELISVVTIKEAVAEVKLLVTGMTPGQWTWIMTRR